MLGLLAVAAGCRKKADEKQDPNVVALVNGETLSRVAFERELGREMESSDGQVPTSPEETEPYKRALVESLVDRALLLQAARAANVTITPEEVDRGVLRLSSDYPAEGFRDALAQGQLSMAELKEKTAALLTIEKLFQEHVYPRVAITEDELRKYYDEHAASFNEPESVRAAQIVVKGLDEARRVQSQLHAGKKFADLARKYSLSADAKVGGDLGFFSRGTMPPQFDEVAFRLDVGQVSDIVPTEYGYHLFKILEKRRARRKEFVEVRAQVEVALLKQKRAQAQAEYIKGLKDKADVRINEQTVRLAQARRSSTRMAEP